MLIILQIGTPSGCCIELGKTIILRMRALQLAAGAEAACIGIHRPQTRHALLNLPRRITGSMRDFVS
jgi:hypothetical protein